MGRITVEVYKLSVEQPLIYPDEWCHPLVCRMLDGVAYHDGPRHLCDSFRPTKGRTRTGEVALNWAGVAEEIDRYLRTNQGHQISERAALGVACILVRRRAKLFMLEATLLGDRADYWVGKRPGEKQLLLEVSGQHTGNLENLTLVKSHQLGDNPFSADGYVCVVNFSERMARLWFSAFQE